MKLHPKKVEINDNASDAYERLSMDRRRTLAAPEDDMWATFADLAVPHALTLGAQLVGRFSVDDDNRFHGFYVGDDFEEDSHGLVRPRRRRAEHLRSDGIDGRPDVPVPQPDGRWRGSAGRADVRAHVEQASESDDIR